MDKKILYRLISREISDLELLVKEELNEETINVVINRAENLLDELKLLKSAMGQSEKNKKVKVEEKETSVCESDWAEETEKEEVTVDAPEKNATMGPLLTACLEAEEEKVAVVEEVEQKEIKVEASEKNAKMGPLLAACLETEKEESTVVEEEPQEERKPIGENFKAEKSLNDIIAEKRYAQDEKIVGSVTSLRSSIGINDRILFMRELFDADSEKYDAVVDFIDNCSQMEEAVKYLKQYFTWEKNDTSASFIQLVKRKFAK